MATLLTSTDDPLASTSEAGGGSFERSNFEGLVVDEDRTGGFGGSGLNTSAEGLVVFGVGVGDAVGVVVGVDVGKSLLYFEKTAGVLAVTDFVFTVACGRRFDFLGATGGGTFCFSLLL